MEGGAIPPPEPRVRHDGVGGRLGEGLTPLARMRYQRARAACGFRSAATIGLVRRQDSMGEIDYRAIFDTADAMIAVIDRDHRLLDVNPRFCEVTGAERDAILGRPILEAFPESEANRRRIAEVYDRAFAGERAVVERAAYALRAPGAAPGERTERWWTVRCAPLPEPAGPVARIVLVIEEVTEEARAQAMTDAVFAELQHRVSNLLSLVSVIARRTLDGGSDPAGFLEAFEGRMGALARTHALLTGGNWDGMTLGALVERHLAAHTGRDGPGVSIEGPDVKLGAREAQSIAMALHELATNSAKYGALGRDGGRLEVSWTRDGGSGFDFEWREEGLTGIAEPERTGFGSMILMNILPAQLGGRAERRFEETRHVYRLRVDDRPDAEAAA